MWLCRFGHLNWAYTKQNSSINGSVNDFSPFSTKLSAKLNVFVKWRYSNLNKQNYHIILLTIGMTKEKGWISRMSKQFKLHVRFPICDSNSMLNLFPWIKIITKCLLKQFCTWDNCHPVIASRNKMVPKHLIWSESAQWLLSSGMICKIPRAFIMPMGMPIWANDHDVAHLQDKNKRTNGQRAFHSSPFFPSKRGGQ